VSSIEVDTILENAINEVMNHPVAA